MLNLETNEELYFYSYIKDNRKPSYITFPLTKTLSQSGNNWQMEIFVNDDEEYDCGYLITTGRIDNESRIAETRITIFETDEAYEQLGDEIGFGENGFNFYQGGIVG